MIDTTKKLTPENLNEKCVEIYLKTERNKMLPTELIDEEYLEKTALYGYMIIFGCAFSLSPVILLITFLINLRLSSKGLLMYHRRPIGYKAQNIGTWINICRFLNVVAVANLSKLFLKFMTK